MEPLIRSESTVNLTQWVFSSFFTILHFDKSQAASGSDVSVDVWEFFSQNSSTVIDGSKGSSSGGGQEKSDTIVLHTRRRNYPIKADNFTRHSRAIQQVCTFKALEHYSLGYSCLVYRPSCMGNLKHLWFLETLKITLC